MGLIAPPGSRSIFATVNFPLALISPEAVIVPKIFILPVFSP